jgi:tRNA (guanine-N7-)-methyltransferase
MDLTPRADSKLANSALELIPQTYVAALDLLAIFGRRAPLQVDLGCGEGSFLCELARRQPEKNLLGIDKLAGRVQKACRKAAELQNVRFLNVESSYAVRYLLPESSVETFYLLFPDPWPKRRHHRRRIVTPEFLSSINVALEGNGTIYIATDHLDYFEEIERIARADPGLTAVLPVAIDLPLTKFERQFRARDAAIHWLELRKTSPVR